MIVDADTLAFLQKAAEKHKLKEMILPRQNGHFTKRPFDFQNRQGLHSLT